MRTSNRPNLTTHIGSLLLLTLIICSCLPPAAFADDSERIVSFRHIHLGQSGTLCITAEQCRMELRGSIPDSMTLNAIKYRQLDHNRWIRIYAGWPRNDQGRISGVSNRSSDPTSRRVYENKLGPTIVWVVAGCRDVCIKGIVLHYDVTLIRAQEHLFISRIDVPIADGCATTDGCLAPTFHGEPDSAGIVCAGAIDQPGCTISAIGDTCRDLSGQTYTITNGDRIEIAFKHRAIIMCDGDAIGITDWGYRLNAIVGKPANQIAPKIYEQIAATLLVKNDPDPFKRAQFTSLLAAAQMLADAGLKPGATPTPR